LLNLITLEYLESMINLLMKIMKRTNKFNFQSMKNNKIIKLNKNYSSFKISQ